MSLNIKNNEVHELVRDLATTLGISQTSAVEVAVRAKLDELAAQRNNTATIRAERIHTSARALQAAVGHGGTGADLWNATDDLHDPLTGLPR